MGKKGTTIVLASGFLSLCLLVQQTGATSVWDDMRDKSNAITGKIKRLRVDVSTVDFELINKDGVSKRYQLCKSDLRGRSPSVALLQSALQSDQAIEVYPSDMFNSCVDGVAAVRGGNK